MTGPCLASLDDEDEHEHVCRGQHTPRESHLRLREGMAMSTWAERGVEICSRCGHPRRDHTDRYVVGPGRLRGCPLPCECAEFELRAAPAPVDAAPLGEVHLRADPPDSDHAGTVVDAGPDELLRRADDAMRCFGPGTTEGGRAEAGWLPAGRIVGDGPEILPEAAVDVWKTWGGDGVGP